MMNGIMVTFTSLLKEASNMQTVWLKMRQKERKKETSVLMEGEIRRDEKNSQKMEKR